FFQAEDGIRDLYVTGVQTCALPISTGHYVASRALPGGGRALHRALDPARDQSYFLYATTAEQLDFLRFPLGEMEKTETRALAKEIGRASCRERVWMAVGGGSLKRRR